MISDITREKGKFLSQTRDHVTEEGAAKSRFLPAGSLILSNSGTVCVPKILAVDGCIHDGVVAFPDLPSDFEILYLYYYFDFIRPRIINAHRQGITQVNLNTEIVKNIRLPVPPLDQQKRIVAEIEKQFSRLDEAVANLKRVKANLKRYKAAVLKAAVEGRLVETEAELARREGRSYETGAQLLHRILETRRSQWRGRGKYKEPAAPDTTDLPELPEGWVWASLDQLSWDSGYGTSAKCAYENEGPPVLRIPNVDKAAIDLTDVKYAPSDFPLGEGEALSPGDMLVIRTNGSKSLIGRAAIVMARFPQPTTFASYLIRFRLLDDEGLSAWLLSYWQSHSSRMWIESKAATSAGQHNISMSVLGTAPVPLPSIAEQHRIVAEVDRRVSLVRDTGTQVDANLRRAGRLRQSILSKVFSA
jgi:type I restriction enzyme S subunit